MSDNNIGNMDDTDTSTTNNQAPVEKTYTQKEFDDHMAKLKSSISRKYEKTFADLGDIDELRQLKAEREQQQLELQKKRGEFDKIIADLAAKKDAEIAKRDEIIKSYTVDLPLVNTAAQLGAVNPKDMSLNDLGAIVNPVIVGVARLTVKFAVIVADEKDRKSTRLNSSH